MSDLIPTTPAVNPKPDFPVHLDDTAISTFRACPALWYYKYVLHLRPRGTKSIDLVAGGAYARGLQEARELLFATPDPDFEAIICSAWKVAIAYWGDYEYDPLAVKALPNILLAIESYFLHWGISTDPLKPVLISGDPPTPAVEVSFALPIGVSHPQTGEPILYTGRIDFIAKTPSGVWTVDDKTGSQLAKTWHTSWDTRSQFTGYSWAMRESGIPVNGGAIRGCFFTSAQTRFAEAYSRRADWQVEEWLRQTRDTIAAMIRVWDALPQRPPQALGQACNAYNRQCEFTLLCTAPYPERYYSTEYEVFIWNPLENDSLSGKEKGK